MKRDQQSKKSVESAVEEAQAWANGLHLTADRIRHHFPRSEPRHRALAYLKGLLSPVERKNGWQLAERAGDETPYGVQHLLRWVEWNADEVRNVLPDYAYLHNQAKRCASCR